MNGLFVFKVELCLLFMLQLEKLKELPKIEEYTMEMIYDYFPWTQVKNVNDNPRFAPFNKAAQPANFPADNINHTEFLDKAFAKLGLKIKV